MNDGGQQEKNAEITDTGAMQTIEPKTFLKYCGLLLSHISASCKLFIKILEKKKCPQRNAFLPIIPNDIKENECPDQYVGTINEIAGSSFERTEINRDLQKEYCIILVLESPHIKEYMDEHNCSPAMGTTGQLIQKGIQHVTNKEQFADYGLILMNAIPFQCSLGVKTSLFRTNVFKNLWDNGGRQYFVERLKKIVRPGDIICNCCTIGVKNSERKQGVSALSDLVWDALTEACKENKRIRMTHPSSWRIGKNAIYSSFCDFVKKHSSKAKK